MTFRYAAPVAAVVFLAGCSGQAVKDLNRAPAMSPIGSGLNLARTNELALYPKEPQQVATGYSLWSDSKSALFKDARALQVGDILTVRINIDDKATFDNKTERSRENSWSKAFNLFGTDTHNTQGLDAKISNSAKTDSKGDGSIARKEQLNLQIAVVVTGVMENGNLLISGSQEVRVNQELRVLNLAGIARPQDVDAENKISYEKIAEARISYGGRGRISEIQNAPVGQQVVDVFSPF